MVCMHKDIVRIYCTVCMHKTTWQAVQRSTLQRIPMHVRVRRCTQPTVPFAEAERMGKGCPKLMALRDRQSRYKSIFRLTNTGVALP